MASLAARPGRLRRVMTLALALLLFAMQQAAQWHALTHVGDWLQRPHEQSFQQAQPDDFCELCALFAGGAAAAPGGASTAPTPIAGDVPLARVTTLATADAPSFSLSRAPPLRS